MNEIIYTVSKDGESLKIKETWCDCDIVEEYEVDGEWVRYCPDNLKHLEDIVVENYLDYILPQLEKELRGEDGVDEECLSHLGVEFEIISTGWIKE